MVHITTNQFLTSSPYSTIVQFQYQFDLVFVDHLSADKSINIDEQKRNENYTCVIFLTFCNLSKLF